MDRRRFLGRLSGAISGLYLLSTQPFAYASNPIARQRGQIDLVIDSGLFGDHPGRLGFYVDYSERSSLGEHVFYVTRTHGAKGQVSVAYRTGGEAHDTVQGVLSWGDGDFSVKSFSVTVADKASGEHRIFAELYEPVGGALLHHGSLTVAYGVIDDGSIASDAVAIFYDAAASTNGDGTQSNPFNNIYDAITATAGKRYLYGRGTTVPDGTQTCAPGGVGVAACLHLPEVARESENDRLIIRNWPGNSWQISGDPDMPTVGFYAHSGRGAYTTFKGIEFADLDSTNADYVEAFGIFYHYSGVAALTIENCRAQNINGGHANHAAFLLWGVLSAKVWRCYSSNIQKFGDITNYNTAGVLSFDGQNISVQRCEFDHSHNGVYIKRTVLGYVSASARFNVFRTETGVTLGASGSSGVPHSHSIIQGNLFQDCNAGIFSQPGYNSTEIGEGHWWCCNVFDGCGHGEVAAIMFEHTFRVLIFNNIFVNCRKAWAEFSDFSAMAAGVVFADFNRLDGITLSSQTYEWKGLNFETKEAVFAAGGFAEHDSAGTPGFANTEIDDYMLLEGAACIGAGVNGTSQGIYVTGIERIGIEGLSRRLVPISGFRIR